MKHCCFIGAGRPRLFERDGGFYLMGRNWDKPPTNRGTVLGYNQKKLRQPGTTLMKLSLFRFGPVTLAISKHVILDNAEEENVIDGYYAVPYWQERRGTTYFNTIIYITPYQPESRHPSTRVRLGGSAVMELPRLLVSVLKTGLGKATALIAFVAPLTVLAVEPRITELEFHSEALRREMPFTLVRPVNEAAANGSVLFLLHGRGRNHQSLIDSEKTRAAYQQGRIHPSISSPN